MSFKSVDNCGIAANFLRVISAASQRVGSKVRQARKAVARRAEIWGLIASSSARRSATQAYPAPSALWKATGFSRAKDPIRDRARLGFRKVNRGCDNSVFTFSSLDAPGAAAEPHGTLL